MSVDCTPIFFSNSSSYGERVMIFAEVGLADLASLRVFFETEGGGFRLVAFTILPVAALCATDVDEVGSLAKAQGKSESATVE
jgi:hypothetical protein